MSAPLKTLALCREVRREAAMIKLAEARRAFDQAYTACLQAKAALDESRQWRSEVLSRCTLGQGQDLRESLLPATEALLQQRQQHFAARQSELRAAQQNMMTCRQEWIARERDAVRLQEWQQLQQSQGRREQAMQENRQDEELMPRQRDQMGAL